VRKEAEMAKGQLIPFVVFTVLVSLAGPLFGQASDTVWTRTYGGAGSDVGVAVKQTFDGGYATAGRTDTYGAGGDDFYLVRTDANGDTLWTRTYGGGQEDIAVAIEQTLPDSGFIVAGWTYSFGAGGSDVYLVKTDSDGDTLWTRTYGAGNGEAAYGIQQTYDGGYIIIGHKWGRDLNDVWLIKTDMNGVSTWKKRYGGSMNDYGGTVQQTPDSGYIVAGTTESFGAGGMDFYLLRTDANGDTLWTRTYGGTGKDDCWCVDRTLPDSGYIVAGYTHSAGAGSADVYIVKTDANGDTLWTKTYGGADDEWAYWIEQTPDGGYVLSGWTESFGSGAGDVYILRTNPSGDTLWTRTYGGASRDWGVGLQVTADGGCIVTGHTRSYGAGESDVYLLKIEDLCAYVRRHEECPPFTISEWAPNPLQSSARISFDLPAAAHLDIGVYDVTGRLVTCMESGMYQTGRHTLVWDGTDSRGAPASPGIYFCRFKASHWEASRKIVLVR
jgi:hypothetical protein